jgi:cyanobactin maturation PatA/PatG family protease
VTTGDPAICIAVIDGKINKTHPALAGADIEILETPIGAFNGSHGFSAHHGTHVASVIFGQHDSIVKGISPRCKGLSLPVFFDDVDGNAMPCSQLDLARAILQAADAGAHIINISGGELNNSGAAHPLLAQAVNQCVERNVLIITAAGNDGCSCLHIPGALPSVLVVGGMNSDGNPLEFSNWGAAYWTQGILAPGENIPGAVAEADTALHSGTSFATPIVSGIAALLLCIQKKRGDKPDPLAIRQALLNSVDGCKDWQTLACQRLLKGRINIKGAFIIIETGKKQNMEIPNPNQESLTESGSMATQMDETFPPKVVASDRTMETVSPHMAESHLEELTNTSPGQQGIMPSCGGDANCSCGSKKAVEPVQKVYALGTLGYDLVSEARREGIAQHMGEGNPQDPTALLKYLEANPWDASSITWTLNLNATPIYAILPYGPFAAEGYKRLQEFLGDQLEAGAERISIPGVIAGQIRLMSGQIVPKIIPELRCMYNWNVKALLSTVLGNPPDRAADKRAYEQQESAIANFLERIYYELQNLGTSAQDRAINYAATNSLNTAAIFAAALKDNMQLDTISVERSAICRMDSDCWDVVLCFFDPEKQLVRARKCYRFTIDLSDICPVMVGTVRVWNIR